MVLRRAMAGRLVGLGHFLPMSPLSGNDVRGLRQSGRGATGREQSCQGDSS
jgi:hypothetical protein